MRIKYPDGDLASINKTVDTIHNPAGLYIVKDKSRQDFLLCQKDAMKFVKGIQHSHFDTFGNINPVCRQTKGISLYIYSKMFHIYYKPSKETYKKCPFWWEESKGILGLFGMNRKCAIWNSYNVRIQTNFKPTISVWNGSEPFFDKYIAHNNGIMKNNLNQSSLMNGFFEKLALSLCVCFLCWFTRISKSH